ncbi:uncharacterized protein LOC144579369 [Callithrix jacchus]
MDVVMGHQYSTGRCAPVEPVTQAWLGQALGTFQNWPEFPASCKEQCQEDGNSGTPAIDDGTSCPPAHNRLRNKQTLLSRTKLLFAFRRERSAAGSRSETFSNGQTACPQEPGLQLHLSDKIPTKILRGKRGHILPLHEASRAPQEGAASRAEAASQNLSPVVCHQPRHRKEHHQRRLEWVTGTGFNRRRGSLVGHESQSYG